VGEGEGEGYPRLFPRPSGYILSVFHPHPRPPPSRGRVLLVFRDVTDWFFIKLLTISFKNLLIKDFIKTPLKECNQANKAQKDYLDLSNY